MSLSFATFMDCLILQSPLLPRERKWECGFHTSGPAVRTAACLCLTFLFCGFIFTGTRQPITSANLGAVTSDDGNEIIFSLIRPPRLGRLILAKDKNQYEEITRFSQTQVTISLPRYSTPSYACKDILN